MRNSVFMIFMTTINCSESVYENLFSNFDRTEKKKADAAQQKKKNYETKISHRFAFRSIHY